MFDLTTASQFTNIIEIIQILRWVNMRIIHLSVVDNCKISALNFSTNFLASSFLTIFSQPSHLQSSF